jgi:hypothetical protein
MLATKAFAGLLVAEVSYLTVKLDSEHLDRLPSEWSALADWPAQFLRLAITIVQRSSRCRRCSAGNQLFGCRSDCLRRWSLLAWGRSLLPLSRWGGVLRGVRICHRTLVCVVLKQ